MRLTPGARLRSQTCTTEVIVIRGGELASDLNCGGRPMVVATGAVERAADPAPGLDGGTLLGKRYGDASLELLVTKAGSGSLSVGTEVLKPLQARSLPSSD